MIDVTTLLAGIKTRAEKATEGPWRTWKDGDDRRGSAVETAWAHDEAGEDTELITDWCSPEDARFIAAARTDVPRLVATLEAVAKVHEPVDALMNPGRHERIVKVCTGCGTDDGNWQRWPCPTITAVVAALGGGEWCGLTVGHTEPHNDIRVERSASREEAAAKAYRDEGPPVAMSSIAQMADDAESQLAKLPTISQPVWFRNYMEGKIVRSRVDEAVHAFSASGIAPEWMTEAVCDSHGEAMELALAAADAHDAAHGIHRVSLDDATVERAAVALYVHNNPVGNWSAHSVRVKTPYRDAARAVLAAAVEAGQ